ncbi:MAG: flagellar biosynthesis protein FlhF [Proteobacteria bacterium]|nr:MAG: flagellar biosynthesis protein FlhF [Pseudomonadota bacterium]
MKIKHYRAPDMRQALRQIREVQGPDAVILSSRKIPGGVEVVAAVDYDFEDAPAGGHATGGVQPSDAVRPTPDEAPRAGAGASLFQAAAAPARAAEALTGAPAMAPGEDEDFAVLARRMMSAEARVAGAPAHEPGLPGMSGDAPAHGAQAADSVLGEELRTLRRMLETQLATLAWNDLTRRAPLQTELLRQLTVLGLAHDLAAELVAQLPSRLELAEAHRLALGAIAQRIAVMPERWLDAGGVVALVGPTGVGKTTLMAKLAARWVMRHGPRQLALVSTDAVRIGAQEQVHTFGRLLGVPAYAIEGASELGGLLDHLGDRRLVLVDTAGLGPRDAGLAAELAALAAASPRLETALVLSASMQAGVIEQTLEGFAGARPTSCVLTKLDEAVSLGGAISALIRTKLPLAYLSDGQRVPEDLSPARAHQLIARAVELARKSGAAADEDLLTRRFGAVAHALA